MGGFLHFEVSGVFGLLSQLYQNRFLEMNTLKNKKNLTLKVPSTEAKSNDGQTEDDDLVLKPVYSAKNLRKSSTHFDFDQNNIAACSNTRKQKKLEKNNEVLYRSLIALKTGAVSAIAAKQEEIDELKTHFKFDEELQHIEEELHDLYEERDNLRGEVKDLEQKLQSQRMGYCQMLEEKQSLIEELYAQLGSAQLQIQNMQKHEVIKQKKIKIIEEQNETLFQQLQFEKIAHLGQQSTGVESDEPHYVMDVTQQEGSILSSFHQRNMNHSFDSDKIRQMEQQHKEELHQLSLFYQKRLAEIRELYEKQLQDTNCPKISHQSIRMSHEEYPTSIKDTHVAPQRLSQELLNFPKLSQCYSITKRNLSKADSLSIYSTDNHSPFESEGRLKTFLTHNVHKKRVDFTIPLNEREEEYKTELNSPRKGRETQRTIILDKANDNPMSSKIIIQKKIESNQKYGSFLMGALTGGVVASVLYKLFRK